MRRLPAALRRAIADFAFAYGGLYPDFVYPPPTGRYASFKEELGRIRNSLRSSASARRASRSTSVPSPTRESS
jgi:hypothetical protein